LLRVVVLVAVVLVVVVIAVGRVVLKGKRCGRVSGSGWD
jgi:hypothetical protein